MKKTFFALLIIASLIFTMPVLAETISLDSLSYDELVNLKKEIQLAIWSSREWQEVTVPVGMYKVGEDIPEGKWTILPLEGSYSAIGVAYEDALTETKDDFNSKKQIAWERVKDPSCGIYQEGDVTEVTFELQNDMYVCVEEAACIFTPYNGGPELSFK